MLLTIARHYFIAETFLLIWIDHFYVPSWNLPIYLAESRGRTTGIFSNDLDKISQDLDCIALCCFLSSNRFCNPRESKFIVNMFDCIYFFFQFNILYSVSLNGLTPAFLFILNISDGLIETMWARRNLWRLLWLFYSMWEIKHFVPEHCVFFPKHVQSTEKYKTGI